MTNKNDNFIQRGRNLPQLVISTFSLICVVLYPSKILEIHVAPGILFPLLSHLLVCNYLFALCQLSHNNQLLSDQGRKITSYNQEHHEISLKRLTVK